MGALKKDVIVAAIRVRHIAVFSGKLAKSHNLAVGEITGHPLLGNHDEVSRTHHSIGPSRSAVLLQQVATSKLPHGTPCEGMHLPS